MDQIIAEYPSRNNKKQSIPASKQSQYLFEPQQNDVDKDYWNTLVNRMYARKTEKTTFPEPKQVPRSRTKTALDSFFSYIKERRRDEKLVQPPEEVFDPEEGIYETPGGMYIPGIRNICDTATSPLRPIIRAEEVLAPPSNATKTKQNVEDEEVGLLVVKNIDEEVLTLSQEFQEAFQETVKQQRKEPSLLIRSDSLSENSDKNIFEDEPEERTIGQALQSMKSPYLYRSSEKINQTREYQRTYNADMRVTEMVSMVQSTPTANDRPYVKSLMKQLNIERGGLVGRFSEIVKGTAKKRKQIPIVRGNSNDLTDDVLRAIEMPKRRNVVIGGTEPEVLFSETTFHMKETILFPESSQDDIKIGHPRIARAISPVTAKLQKKLGVHVIEVRKTKPKQMRNEESAFI